MNKKNIFLIVVIPVILFSYSIFASLFLNPYSSFSTITIKSKINNLIGCNSSGLLKNQKITGEFLSSQPFLGIVVFNFNTFNRTNSDKIVFSLREKGGKSWSVINKYSVDRFRTGMYYPFGFPTFNNSKNKIYQFELYSINGNSSNSIAIDCSSSFIKTEYIYPKNFYDRNFYSLIDFISMKLINFITYNFLIPIPIIYFSPLVVYLSILMTSKKNNNIFLNLLSNRTVRYKIFYIVVLFLLINTLFITKNSDIINMHLLLCYIIVVLWYRMESSVTFLLALFFLLVSVPLVVLNKVILAEKAVIQLYFLLIVALLQIVISSVYPKYLKISFKKVFFLQKI